MTGGGGGLLLAGADIVLLAAVLGLAGTVMAVWGGAQLAAVFFGGHRPVPAGLRDTLAALPGLVIHPADPRQAWPDPVAAGLPGPAGYWTATLLPLAVVLLTAAVVVTAAGWGGAGVARRRRMGLNPDARFARVWELMPLWVSAPTPGRMILGMVRTGGVHRLLATENPARPPDRSVPRLLRRRVERRRGGRGAVVVVGPSQCGKTSACAIPAILEWAGPLIALSVKADLMGATLDRRRRLGEVRVFDPTGITGENSSAWSPLRDARRLAGARQAARSIANSTDWNTGASGDMSFWVAAAEDLLTVLFWTAAHTGLGMDSVVGWIQGMDKDTVLRFLSAFAGHTDPDIAAEGQQMLDGFTAVWKTDQRQISSVYLVARQMIRPWQEPAVARSAAHPAIDLPWLLGGGQPHEDGQTTGGANSLFLCADLDEADRLAPVLGGLVDDLIRDVYAQVARTGQPLDPPLLVVIDEAGNWPMRNLPGRISTCAGMGIQLLLVYQSKAQIDAAYDTRADIVLSNAVTKIFFSGLSDTASLDYAASLLGSEHIPARSISADLAPVGAARRGISAAPTRLELLPAALLRQVAPGQALLIHHTLPPTHLHGRYWFRDPQLRALATGEPTHATHPRSLGRTRPWRTLARAAGRLRRGQS
ncbi:type IV secretory system conjugative DNA transfer family protein [Candidatus Protofrankia californiensis]|uniref:type IV secretory system conjugative DNA transfer family protein n=1 Tax=Candidatus Protofrankia californiensis TaxID=1839754 RepID=UPI00104166C8|nr:type IV secretory system conjugative DNA transfer family protein [Candidatus Protofrankia californiensis]